MKDTAELRAFLRTDPRDVGCGQTWNVIHVYVELVLTGHDPELRFPGVTVHLAACAPCTEDFDGLLAALHDGTRRVEES
jgi:hypothetical protein